MRALKPSEVRALRDRLGLSQAGFAETFRLSVRTVQKWEQGTTKPDGAAAVLLWLINHMPQAIIKALKNDQDRPGGSRS